MLTGRLPSDGKVSVRTGHPDLDESHDTVVAQFLAPEPDERHSGALAAREALEGLTWTARTVLRATPGHDVVVPPPTPVFHGEVADAARLRPAARGVAPALHVDGWLERQVRVLSLEAHRVRASLWARAAHPALAMILRVAEADDALWVEAFESPASAEPPLNAAERVRLREALVVLHDLGGGHGAVDRRHVVRCGGAVFWAFPTEPRAAEPAEELATFDRLV